MTADTDFTKQPTYLVKMYPDVCANTFGVASCAASGSVCWYSYTTCKDRSHYSKSASQQVLRFSEKGCDLILAGQHDIKPYLLSIDPITTEIDPDKSITYVGRYRFTFAPDYNPPPEHSAKGAGKYNTSTDGEFWKNFVARNSNLKRRYIELYEGYVDAADESAFTMRFRGTIDNIEFDKDKCCIITAKDLLSQFQDVQIPNAISSENVLVASCSEAAATLQVTDGEEFKTYDGIGCIKIEDSTNGNEYVTFTALSGDYLTGCARGAYGTTAASHSSALKLTQMAIFCESDGTTGVNPADILLDIIQDYIGIDAAYINATSFTNAKTTWLTNLKYRRFIDRPTKAETLLQQVRKLSRSNVWVDESGVIQCRPFRPPLPSDTINDITQDAGIAKQSTNIDDQQESMFTRLLVYYDPIDSGKESTDPDDYSGLIVIVDAQRESANDLGFSVDKKEFAPWIYQESEAKSFAARYMRRFSYPPAKYTITLEKKDRANNVGDLIQITSGDFLGTDGIETAKKFEITKKVETAYTLELTLMDTRINRRYAIIGPNTMSSDYDTATDADKEYGYIGTASPDLETCTVGDAASEDGYYIW